MALSFDGRRARRRPGAGGGGRRASRSAGGRARRGVQRRRMRGEVVGLVGPNGAGKSTLLRAIIGERAAGGGRGAGRRTRSRIAYYRQDLAQVPPDETLYDVIADLRPHWGRGPIQGHLGALRLLRRRGAAAGRHALRRGAGARRARDDDARRAPTCSMFDEPTNHLDVESIEALEDAIDGVRRHRAAGEPRPRAPARAHDPRMGAARAPHHRLSRQLRGMGDGEPGAGARGGRGGGRGGVVRRVKERKQTPSGPDDRQQQHARATDGASEWSRRPKRAVAEWEARVGALRAELEDPHLYLTPEGAQASQSSSGASWSWRAARLDAAFARLGGGDAGGGGAG